MWHYARLESQPNTLLKQASQPNTAKGDGESGEGVCARDNNGIRCLCDSAHTQVQYLRQTFAFTNT